MNWTEVQINTDIEMEDVVSGILYDAGAAGLSIEDPRDIIELTQSRSDWDFVDSSIMNIEKDKIIIKAYFPESEELENIIEGLKLSLGDNPLLKEKENLITFTLLDDNDWAESWKAYYKPFKIGDKILIKPSWEDVDIEEDDMVIELDPGMAFGTGTHETTWMCTEALEKYMKPSDTVYDIGCGSGILSIVAAKLGAKNVVGVDLDPVCISTSRENILRNNVEEIIDIRQGDLFEVLEEKSDIIVSNIIAEIIAKMSGDLKSYLKDEGIFISSGIILDKIQLVENALISNGFTIVDIIRKNEWACIISKNSVGE